MDKNTDIGIIKKVDLLGRISIPHEIYKKINAPKKSYFKFETKKNGVMILKLCNMTCCIFCGKNENIKNFKNKKVCMDCIKNIKDRVYKNPPFQIK